MPCGAPGLYIIIILYILYYYTAGHLPQKQQDYRKKYRTLASTYMTFGPDGSELLVNIGGEQIYLFDVSNKRRPQRYTIGQQSNSQTHADSKGRHLLSCDFID